MGEKPIIFGMYTVKEFIHYCAYLVMGAVFLVLFNQRLAVMESRIEIFSEYIINSDNYHSRVLGVRFKNGEPTGDEAKIQKVRHILNGESETDNLIKKENEG